MSDRKYSSGASIPERLAAFIALAHERRSVSPRRLSFPVPSLGELRCFVETAITAPDHGALRPWRFLLINNDHRMLLADAFACAEYELNPGASHESLNHVREKALAGPCLIALIAVTRMDRPDVPVAEQFVSVGAALQNFLLAIRAAGYDGKIVSGEKTTTVALRTALGLGENEVLVGFIALGTASKPPPVKPRPCVDEHFGVWPA